MTDFFFATVTPCQINTYHSLLQQICMEIAEILGIMDIRIYANFDHLSEMMVVHNFQNSGILG
jgi:hypothetical protein